MHYQIPPTYRPYPFVAWVPLFSRRAGLTFPANHKPQGGWVAGWRIGNRKPHGGWVAACAWRSRGGVCRWWFLGPPQAPLSRASGCRDRHKPRSEARWPTTGPQCQAITLPSQHTEHRATAPAEGETHSRPVSSPPPTKPQTTGGLGGWSQSKKPRATGGLGGWVVKERGR